MRKEHCFAVAFLLLLVVPLEGQVAPSAQGTQTPLRFWVGASISTFNPDYGCVNNSPVSCWNHHLIGVSPYLDTNYFAFDRVGVEAEARLLLWHGPATLIESSYLAGPRVRLYSSRDLNFAGKFLVGRASLDVPDHLLGGGGYFAYAPGAEIDYRLARHVAARVEYEYQRWPAYPCFKCGSGGVGGLTPNGFSFGVSYALPTSRTE